MDEKTYRQFSNYIYKPILLQPTEKLLKNTETIEEKDIIKKINKYYNYVKKYKNNELYIELTKSIENLNYFNINRKFKIINSEQSILVFIEKDKKASLLIKEYKKLKNKDKIKYIEQYYKIKNKLLKYVISINITNKRQLLFTANLKDVGIFKLVSKDILNYFYDKDFGFYIKNDKFI